MESRLVTARKFGADHVINIGRVPEKQVIAEVREMCRPDGADAVIEVCGVPEVINQGLQMLRTGGRYVLGGLVNPGANVTIDANMLVKRWVTMRGIHNYHPRHLIQALDFVMSNRNRFPFKEIVDSKFGLQDLDAAFKKASERTVLRAAIVPGYRGLKHAVSARSISRRTDCSSAVDGFHLSKTSILRRSIRRTWRSSEIFRPRARPTSTLR